MTVAELLARMSSAELTEWRAYAALLGLGGARADWRAGLVAAMIANVNRRKGARPFRPEEFMPRLIDRDAVAPTSGGPGTVALASFLHDLRERGRHGGE